jgi:DNA helicase-4
VGKVAYAVHKGLFKPHEILTLTFNKAATRELSERITRYARLNSDDSITSRTFHALGYTLISQHRGSNGRLKPVSDSRKKRLLKEAIDTCLLDATFLARWVHFVSYFKQPEEDYHSYKNAKDYEDHIDYQKKRARQGKPVSYKALNDCDVLKSAEELEIANWCFINGVPFEYEKSFPFLPEGWTKYEPDFYFPEIDTWLEHFALNADGSSPFKFNYETQAVEKRQWLERHVPGRWFETQSHEFYSGTLIEKLKAALTVRGQKLRPMDAQTILKHIRSLNKQDETNLFLSVIGLIKNRDINTQDFQARLHKAKNKPRAQAFINVFLPIFAEYQQRLKDQGLLDFDDMISMAAQLLEEKTISSPYKLILVDEFQDISSSRTRLLKALLAQHPQSVLFGVGDDWQAINGFAGSDLNFFMKFEDVFGYAAEHYLTETFRCAQNIADVSATFIQENRKGQKLKSVRSRSSINGTIDLIGYGRENTMRDRLEETLVALFDEAQKQKTSAKVQILGRYGISKIKELSQHHITQWNHRFAGYLSIEYMTAHGSKGLEADYVIIVGMTGGRGMTFPSSFTSDPIIDALSNNQDTFLHAEERRLFYVAMTRAKQKVFILFSTTFPSPFIGEIATKKYAQLITLENKPFQYCANCELGAIIEKTGPHGEYHQCLACDKAKSKPNGRSPGKGYATRKSLYRKNYTK